jgi:hypothetical protein
MSSNGIISTILPYHSTHVNTLLFNQKNRFKVPLHIIFPEKANFILKKKKKKKKKITFTWGRRQKHNHDFPFQFEFFFLSISLNRPQILHFLHEKWFEWSLQSCGVDLLNDVNPKKVFPWNHLTLGSKRWKPEEGMLAFHVLFSFFIFLIILIKW